VDSPRYGPNDFSHVTSIGELLTKVEKRAGFCVEAKIRIPLHASKLFKRQRIAACRWEQLVEGLPGLRIDAAETSVQHVVA
jgi:hypothetical protein